MQNLEHPSSLRPVRSLALALLLLVGAPAAAKEKTAGIDLVADRLEVTQAIQDGDNSVRLVAGKGTWVRLHAHAAGLNGNLLSGVRARLVASRLAPGPVTFLGFVDSDPTTVAKDPQASRFDTERSLNFLLPAAWRTGTVQMAVLLDFHADFKEVSEANNILIETVTFEAVPPVRVRSYAFPAADASLATALDLALMKSWLRRAYPTAAVSWQERTTTSPVDWWQDRCNCTRNMAGNCVSNGSCQNDAMRVCNKDSNCGCDRMNDILTMTRAVDAGSPDTFAPDRRYVGIVYGSNTSTEFMRGCSPGVQRKVAAGPTGPSTFDWDFDGSYGDWYTAHELGHAYGRPHAPCCGATLPNPPPPPFPYLGADTCDIGLDDVHVGFDIGSGTAFGPDADAGDWRDLMSYCDFQWVSDYTYEELMKQLQAEDGEPLPPLLGPGNFMLLLATHNPEIGVANITEFLQYAAPAAPAARNVGDYTVELYDPAGSQVSSVAIDAVEVEDDTDLAPSDAPQRSGGTTVSLFEVLPVPPGGLGRVAIVKDGMEIASRSASANAPTVTLTAPLAGVIADGTVVEWEAEDLDNDPLTAMVQLSGDGGSTWQVLGVGIVGESLVLSLDGFAGSDDVRLRVVVSDGFDSASDESAVSLSMADAAPLVQVLSPPAGTLIGGLQGGIFEAAAEDAEDGTLGGDSLVWTSDRQGVFATGATAEQMVVLVPGTHVVTVTATDDDGNTSEDSVEVVVERADADACPALPREDCDAMAGRLLYRDRGAPADRRLALKMNGDSVLRSGADFGDPTDATTLTLCVYESGLLRTAVAMAPGADTWRELGSRGFVRRDRTGAAITKAVLKAGTDVEPGPVTVVLKGAGEALPSLSLPMAFPMEVQLVREEGEACFAAELLDARRNGRGELQARGPGLP